MCPHRRLAVAWLIVGAMVAKVYAAETNDSTSVPMPALTGRADVLTTSLDEALVKLVSEHEIPGAALAVSYQGRLIYARGAGHADVDEKLPLQPHARFRIASISKPITAVAVMRLVEGKKLRLDDKVFDLLGTPRSADSDPRLSEITVHHCLRHTGGWDRDKSFDPMFRSIQFATQLNVPPPATAAHVIQCMLGVPLDFAPGERYAYSNFGYCLLGRVIEKVTGMPYEAYVKAEVLEPLGVQRMQLGKTLLAGRAEDEVRYYDQANGPAVLGEEIGKNVPQPYGAWHLEAMDSHGGWIASAPDLVRFASSLDCPEQCPILNAASIEAMFARPDGAAGYDEKGNPKATYYACGWNVRPAGTEGRRSTWHGGSLPGTSTLLMRRHDGINWAVLFNRRDGKQNRRLSAHADEMISAAIEEIGEWPEYDLFTPKRK